MVSPSNYFFNPSGLTNVNGNLYFTSNDFINGRELWKIDSAGKAVLVTDIVRFVVSESR